MSTTGGNLELVFNFTDAENNWGSSVNEDLLKLDTFSQISVIDITNTPPGSASNGDLYWVGSTGTGVWAGKDEMLAVYYSGEVFASGQWGFYDVKEGWQIYDQSENRLKVVGSASTLEYREVKDVQEIVDVTTSVNAITSKIYQVTLSNNWTPNFSFGSNDIENELTIIVIQDGVGGHTVTWPGVMWAGGTTPTLTGDADSIDIFKFIYDGTNTYGFTVGLDYSTPA